MRHQSYFRKLQFTYIVPGIFFILVTGILLGCFYMSSMKRELGIQTQAYLGQVTQKIDYNIEVFSVAADKLKTQEDFRKLVLGEGSPYQAASDTLASLNHFFLNASIGGTFAVTTPELPFVLSQTGTLPMQSFIDKMNLDTKQAETIDQVLENSPEYPFTMLPSENTAPPSKQKIVFIQHEELAPGKTVLFLFVFPKQTLLPEASGYMSATTLFSWKIQENQPKWLQNEISKESLNLLRRDSKIDVVFYETKGAWNFVKTLNYLPGYAAAIEVNRQDVWTELASKLLLTLAICFALLAIFVALAYRMTKHMYKPINTITQMFSAMEKGNNKEKIYDEFDYIRSVGNHLQKDLTAQRTTLKSKFLHDMLYGMADRKEAEKNIVHYDLGIYETNPCVVGILTLANEAELELSYAHDDVSNLKNQTVHLFLNALHMAEYAYESVQMEASTYAVILQIADPAKISCEIENILEDINAIYNITLVCFLGKQVESFYDIHASYESALRIRSFFFNDSDKLVYLPGELTENETMYYYPVDMERNLINAVVHQNRRDMDFILSYLIRENLTKRVLSNESLKEFLFSLSVTAKRILHTLNKTVEDVFEADTIFYLEFKLCDTNTSMKAKIEEIFDKLYQAKERETEYSGDFREQIWAFMEKNYTKDISLTDIAAHFGMSESHMSKKFKSCIGDTFKNTFNIFRVEKAKEILAEQPDILIYRLSEQLGFNNANSFIRTFKRHTGISPAKYWPEQKKGTNN